MSDLGGLEAIEPWIEGYLRKLTPAERTKVARKIGTRLRQENSKRIRANMEPDGAAMEPRKPKKGRKGKLHTRKGKMFRRLGLLRSLRVRPTPDGVTVDFVPRFSSTAAVHHFGEIDSVDHKKARAPRVRFAARRLLGFSVQDRDAIMEDVIKWADGSATN